MSSLARRITEQALDLGFSAAGIAPAEPGEHLPFYKSWLADDYHGEQSYLARIDRLARRQDLRLIMPGVQSLVVVGLHYWPGPPPSEAGDPAHGRISCYAQHTDYHTLMLRMLQELHESIQAETEQHVRGRAYVDTGSLLERDHAVRAGLGFFGKNCCLIQPRRGSWLFLGQLLLDIALEPAVPERKPGCGSCTRCLDACPTGALVQPYTLDSRRCISYLTTALKGSIPRALRPLIGNRVFGCDTCQAACPWNRFARPVSPAAAMDPHHAGESPGTVARPLAARPLLDLIALSEDGFQDRYGRTPIGHIGRERFLRNVAVALGNWGSPEAAPGLGKAMAEPSPLVRSHAAWALGQIGIAHALALLERARTRETNPGVAEEIDLAMRTR
jgi:epoxyqueuosine reductase